MKHKRLRGGILSKQKSTSRSWTFETRTASEIVWKLLISPVGILCGEERDTAAKTGSLFALEVQTGRVLWRGVRLEEAWWFNSERATDDTLYVQSFRKPDLPEAKGITAIDLKSGAIRWQQPEFALIGTEPKRVLVARQGFTGREYYALDVKTGETVEEFGRVQPQIPEDADLRETHFASPLKQMPAELAAMHSEIVGPVDELHYGIYRIYGNHTVIGERKLLSNELLVFKKEDLVFRETIHAETPLPQSENFFVSHGFLLYVKETRTLVGVDLRA